MPTITITYTWSVPDTFDINFDWRVVAEVESINFPTLITSGPQNSLFRPTLLFPNGNENILGREIEISWLENFPPSVDNTQVWYEVFFSENYDYVTEPDWKMIAVVPSGVGKYNWKIGNTIKSKNVRCAVRAVNSRGERSTLSISAASFSIKKSVPNTPVVISPIPNSRYGSSITFNFDDSGILNTFSQRAKYNIYMSSIKAGVPFTPIVQNIPVGTGPIVWDATFVPASDDYVLTVFLLDDDGNKSQEVNIDGVAILHDSFFLIDTKPPTGYVQINNSAQYTKSLDVAVKVFAYDDITGVHAMQFIEGDKDDVIGSPEAYTNMKYWTLQDEDGEKILKLRIQDFGGNRSLQTDKVFRVLFDLDNADISDVALNKRTGDVWAAINGDAPAIYKFTPASSLITYVNEEINCITFYDNVLYISAKTEDSTALIYRWTGFLIEEVFALTNIDSEVVSVQEYRGKLYLGSRNGDLHVYDKSVVSTIKNFGKQISKLYSDVSLLYIVTESSKNLQVFDGSAYTEVQT